MFNHIKNAQIMLKIVNNKANKNNTTSDKAKELQKKLDEANALLEKYVGNPQQSAKIAVPPKA